MDRTFSDSFYWVKSENRAKLLVLSDLHFNKNLELGILFRTLIEIESNFCDYILIAGDLIDDNNYLEDERNYEVLKWFLGEISRRTPVIMVLGECDTRWLDGKNTYKAEPKALIRMVSELKNVHLLRDEFYEDEKIRIFGACQDSGCLDVDFLDSLFEDDTLFLVVSSLEVTEMEKSIVIYDSSTSEKDTEKTNILLLHSDEPIRDKKIKKELGERFDLVISGHKHNLALPDWLFNLGQKLFSSNLVHNGNLWSIVCRPLTVFPKNPLLQKLYHRGYSIVMLSR